MDSYFPPVGGPAPTVARVAEDPHQRAVAPPPAAFEIDDFLDEIHLDGVAASHTNSTTTSIGNGGRGRRRAGIIVLVGLGVTMACFFGILSQTSSSSSSSSALENEDVALTTSSTGNAVTTTPPTRHKHHSAVINNASDPVFQQALKGLIQSIHEDPETTALAEWYRYGPSVPPLTDVQKHQQRCTHYFPGFDAALIQRAIRGQRLAFVGDATVGSLTKWLQLLLWEHISPEHLDRWADMGLHNATRQLNPHHYDQTHTNHKNMSLSFHNNGDIGDHHGTFVQYYNSRGADPTNNLITAAPQLVTSPHESHCSWPNHMWKQVHNDKPTIMVVNYGLELLHLMGQGNDVSLCEIVQWKHYPHFLEEALITAHKSNVHLVLFKTTNLVCPVNYTEAWAAGVVAYNDTVRRNTTVNTCITMVENQIQQDTSGHDWSQALTKKDIEDYCGTATMDPRGVETLNERLHTFVDAFQFNQSQHSIQQEQQHKDKNGRELQQQQPGHPSHHVNLTVAIYNDHDLQSCDYSVELDGQQFPGLNLARIRLLGNMIQCLYSY